MNQDEDERRGVGDDEKVRDRRQLRDARAWAISKASHARDGVPRLGMVDARADPPDRLVRKRCDECSRGAQRAGARGDN